MVRWKPPPRPRAATPARIYRVLNGTGYIGDEDPDAVIPQTFGRRGGLMGNADKILATIDEFMELGVDTFHLQFPNDILVAAANPLRRGGHRQSAGIALRRTCGGRNPEGRDAGIPSP